MLKFWMKLSVASVLLLTACGEGEKEESADKDKSEQSEEKDTADKVCHFTFDENATTVKWTAFKFTNKTGVGGEFKSITVTDVNEGDSPYEVLQNATFSIPISSIDTKNPDRDKKIKEHFFNTMAETEQLKGQIKSWEEGSETATLALKMNGVEKDVEVKIAVDEEKVSLTTTIDVNDFNAQASIEKLNEVCKDLHKGPDGESMLWSEVDIVVETTLEKTCE